MTGPREADRPGVPRANGVRRPPLSDGVLADPVTVAVLADDPVTGQGAAAYLASCAGVKLLPEDRRDEAEVVLILVSWVTEETLGWLRQVAESARPEARFVLVGDGVRDQHVARSIGNGPMSVIQRQEADFRRILRAIAAVRQGRLEEPGVAFGWLSGQIRAIQQDVLDPNTSTPAALESRETTVLRLLADGLGTPEIALRLNFSERTVKNIIHGVLARWKLHNRAHAVAFALRNGAI